MPWSGFTETEVTQLTYTEWLFSLRAKREVQIGYSVRVGDAWGGWELFGDSRWLWFTGVVAGYSGAIQIVSQWVEVESLGPRHRVWQWVHWRNPSDVDVVVKPYFLLAPPIDGGWLMQSEQTTARRRVWTVADLASPFISALGTVVESPGGDDTGGDTGGAGGGIGGRGVVSSIALRPLENQNLREIELEGDLRYLPVQELWGRIDRILEDIGSKEDLRPSRHGRKGKPSKISSPTKSKG